MKEKIKQDIKEGFELLAYAVICGAVVFSVNECVSSKQADKSDNTDNQIVKERVDSVKSDTLNIIKQRQR